MTTPASLDVRQTCERAAAPHAQNRVIFTSTLILKPLELKDPPMIVVVNVESQLAVVSDCVLRQRKAERLSANLAGSCHFKQHIV